MPRKSKNVPANTPVLTAAEAEQVTVDFHAETDQAACLSTPDETPAGWESVEGGSADEPSPAELPIVDQSIESAASAGMVDHETQALTSRPNRPHKSLPKRSPACLCELLMRYEDGWRDPSAAFRAPRNSQP
jgi:hypothetical protein